MMATPQKPEKTYSVEISQEALLFLTELLIKLAVGAMANAISKGLYFEKNVRLEHIHISVMHSIESTLRELLYEPLRDASFRHLFRNHISKHPDSLIRDSDDWLMNVLNWDK